MISLHELRTRGDDVEQAVLNFARLHPRTDETPPRRAESVPIRLRRVFHRLWRTRRSSTSTAGRGALPAHRADLSAAVPPPGDEALHDWGRAEGHWTRLVRTIEGGGTASTTADRIPPRAENAALDLLLVFDTPDRRFGCPMCRILDRSLPGERPAPEIAVDHESPGRDDNPGATTRQAAVLRGLLLLAAPSAPSKAITIAANVIARRSDAPTPPTGAVSEAAALTIGRLGGDASRYLAGANLTDAQLPNEDLRCANLLGADLVGARLVKANLSRANLTGANLARAELTWSDLHRVDLTGASLTGADLIEADLTGAVLADANLTRANLSGTTLTNADLTGADLTAARLSNWPPFFGGAVLVDADLTGADLTDADLEGADLTGANLCGARLTRADLTRAQLGRAVLARADLTDATGVQVVAGVVWDRETRWPEGLADDFLARSEETNPGVFRVEGD
ncbi:pentapeptide repeat-containing protein [Embleya scabrispora]|uniref:pentapeptide repeat-containing protein n=1 Tax=Embleya scabrispora TaxID=159449 RepID=UPI00036AD1AF|nr:pentapeptide repeat-containing protein [Embleya scabrispora]MYS82822.1 hypothetical protein [Streptomyces sp. SID5474]